MFTSFIRNENDLLMLMDSLYGKTIKKLSSVLLESCPKNFKKDKGCIGKLIEVCLGIKTTTNTEQDFAKLGIEVKTILINSDDIPFENTSICLVPLIKNTGLLWKNSYFFNKIKKILWVPIKINNNQMLGDAKIERSFIWSPNVYEKKILKNDWNFFMNLIVMGKIEKITSSMGKYLQIRSKARNRHIKTKGIGVYGEIIKIIPKSFYFKKDFTKHLIKSYMKKNII